MAATETITSIILIKLIRVSLGTVRHPRRLKIVVIDIQITLKQMLRDFMGIRVNRAKKSGMVNITSSVNSRERSGINTILHDFYSRRRRHARWTGDWSSDVCSSDLPAGAGCAS